MRSEQIVAAIEALLDRPDIKNEINVRLGFCLPAGPLRLDGGQL